MDQKPKTEIKQPVQEHSIDKLPSAVTFFVSVKQRRLLLNALHAFSDNRSAAILMALGLAETESKT